MYKDFDIERLNDLGDELESLEKPIKVSKFNTPLNKADEQNRLYAALDAGETYNPQFVYEEAPTDYDRPLIDFLRKLDPTLSAWEKLIFDQVVQILGELETLQTHSPAQITANSIQSSGLPTPDLVAAAQEYLQQNAEDIVERNIPAEDAADSLRSALARAQLAEWKVVVDPVMNARMMVRSVDKEVYVNANAEFNDSEIKRLLVHEVGTHVFRYVNGEAQPLRLLRKGLSGYIMTEEGMATYNETKYDVQDISVMRKYALRVICAYMALTHSFVEVFTNLIEYTTRDEAFDIVTRAKRGFRDTSEYGAHIKDKVYFEGYRKVSTHLQENPEDYELLMSGKIKLEMLPAIRELQKHDAWTSPKLLPDLFFQET